MPTTTASCRLLIGNIHASIRCTGLRLLQCQRIRRSHNREVPHLSREPRPQQRPIHLGHIKALCHNASFLPSGPKGNHHAYLQQTSAVIRMLKSTAAAECVNAPTDTKSTPASA